MKIKYQNHRINSATVQLIKQANSIIAEYQQRGYAITLRQLYYQFVARGLIENKIQSYRKIGVAMNTGRMLGLVDWSAIIDRTRNLASRYHSIDARHAVDQTSQTFCVDMWNNQKHRVEIWIEKEALIGVIEHVCERNDVPYFACKGYNSQSEQWNAAQRLLDYKNVNGQTPVIIHLGDHDPSGLDASRDIDDRFTVFTGGIAFERIALNMDQIEELQPPENPAKLTDPRGSEYVEMFGESSWELDALSPDYMENLVQETINRFLDPDDWQDALDHEAEERTKLKAASQQWAEVLNILDLDDVEE